MLIPTESQEAQAPSEHGGPSVLPWYLPRAKVDKAVNHRANLKPTKDSLVSHLVSLLWAVKEKRSQLVPRHWALHNIFTCWLISVKNVLNDAKPSIWCPIQVMESPWTGSKRSNYVFCFSGEESTFELQGGVRHFSLGALTWMVRAFISRANRSWAQGNFCTFLNVGIQESIKWCLSA